MSKNTTRKDKTCLNCRHVVEQKFCPNCGQENTESRKTFHHLFIHFFEDLTHYENAFWKTIRNLLFKPSTLTKEYLSGKRLSYLAPVRLYIFISFITFLLLALFPSKVNEAINKSQAEITKEIPAENKAYYNKTNEKINQKVYEKTPKSIVFDMNSVRQLDSVQKYGKPKDKYNEFEYWALKKILTVSEHYTKNEILEKFLESFFHNIPKILFIIMPLFAFLLWIFHSKKRWYYFDHGIFTLHYFSFLLLIFLILFIIRKIAGAFGEDNPLTIVSNITDFVGFIWMAYYFYPAHHRFYGESRFVSFIKSFIILTLNFFIILFLLIFYVFYIFINLH